jgi:DNA repair protein RecO (recombination protein O)
MGSLVLMAALASGDWAGAEASEPAARREASGLVAAHLQWHLERALRSLPLVDRSGETRPTVGVPGPAEETA